MKVWNNETRNMNNTLHEHNDGVNDIVIDTAGKLLVSASHDGSIMRWDF